MRSLSRLSTAGENQRGQVLVELIISTLLVILVITVFLNTAQKSFFNRGHFEWTR